LAENYLIAEARYCRLNPCAEGLGTHFETIAVSRPLHRMNLHGILLVCGVGRAYQPDDLTG
jgi:hypothetical protein